MLHFIPNQNRVIRQEFWYYFIAIAITPCVIHLVKKGISVDSSLLLSLLASGIFAYSIGYAKSKSKDRDIEIHEECIIGPGPLHWLTFKHPRVKVDLARLRAQKDERNWQSLTDRKVLKLGEKGAAQIYIVKSLYQKELLDELEKLFA